MNWQRRIVELVPLVALCVGAVASFGFAIVPLHKDPFFRAEWVGYDDLRTMDEKLESGADIGALWRDEPGFYEIYRILQLIERTLPDAYRLPSDTRKPAVFTRSIQTYQTSTDELPVLQPVKVQFPDGSTRTVCFMPYLRSAIEMQRLSFWARCGLVAVVVGTVLTYFNAKYDARKTNKSLHHCMDELQTTTDHISGLERQLNNRVHFPTSEPKQTADTIKFLLGAGCTLAALICTTVAFIVFSKWWTIRALRDQ